MFFAKTKVFQFTVIKFWLIFVKTRKTPRALTKSATSSHLPNIEPLWLGEAGNTKLPRLYLCSIIAQISPLCDSSANKHPYWKNYDFTILQAKPKMVKPLWQSLWHLPVYVNTNKNTISAFAHHTYYDKSEKSLQVIFTDTLTVNMNCIAYLPTSLCKNPGDWGKKSRRFSRHGKKRQNYDFRLTN